MATRVDFLGRLDGKARTPQGGLRVSANLTRTGIFLYRDAKGNTIREYRPADEVFKADSLETLKLAPVTVGHPAAVRTDNFKEVNVGVVAENVRPNGIFVSSDVLLQDKGTIDRADAGELVELSCGYEVDIDRTPGETPEGERYDAIQRNIRYNHVALGPANWGRAGSSVRIHLDAADDGALRLDDAGNVLLGESDSYSPGMPTLAEETTRADAAESQVTALKSERDKLQAKLDAAAQDLEKARADQRNLIDPKDLPTLIASRVALESSARSVLGTDATFTKKVSADGKDQEVPMTDDDIKRAVLAKVAPETKLDGKSADYITARFDAAIESASRQDAAHGRLQGSIDRSIAQGGTVTKSKLDAAHEKAAAQAKEDAQGGAPKVAGSLTRK